MKNISFENKANKGLSYTKILLYSLSRPNSKPSLSFNNSFVSKLPILEIIFALPKGL